MGCNAALMTKKVIDNSFVGAEYPVMTILQAIDYLDCSSRLAPKSKALYAYSGNIPEICRCRPKYKDLQNNKRII